MRGRCPQKLCLCTESLLIKQLHAHPEAECKVKFPPTHTHTIAPYSHYAGLQHVVKPDEPRLLLSNVSGLLSARCCLPHNVAELESLSV